MSRQVLPWKRWRDLGWGIATKFPLKFDSAEEPSRPPFCGSIKGATDVLGAVLLGTGCQDR